MPIAANETSIEATPDPSSVSVPIVVAPLRNVTVPLFGVPPPGAVAVTVAVSVTVVPTVVGFWFTTNAVAVFALLTTWLTVLLVLPVQDTWLWRMDAKMAADDHTHANFWQRLARWLVDGVPEGSRAVTSVFLHESDLTDDVLTTVRALNEIASSRGQSLAQLALQWVLREPVVVSAIIGASSVAQLEQNLGALNAAPLTAGELAAIDAALA